MFEVRKKKAGDLPTGVTVVVTLALLAGLFYVVLSPLMRCVAAGTRVATPQGPRLVETLRPGDVLWTAGPHGLERGRVAAVRTQLVFALQTLVLSDGRELGLTANHPIATKRGWIQAGALRSSDLVSILGVRPVRLRSTRTVLGPVRVYDLSVEPNPNFFANGVLVHNKRITSPESAAIGNLRTMISAQAAYQSLNHGLYGTPECLIAPAGCLDEPDIPHAFLNESFVFDGVSRGYVFEFHPDPALPEEIPAEASPTSLRSWAMIATPEVQDRTGVRGFCGDASGRICFTPDGSAIELVDGICDPECTVVQ